VFVFCTLCPACLQFRATLSCFLACTADPVIGNVRLAIATDARSLGVARMVLCFCLVLLSTSAIHGASSEFRLRWRWFSVPTPTAFSLCSAEFVTGSRLAASIMLPFRVICIGRDFSMMG